MCKGLAITRTKKHPELYFLIEDSSGETIKIKQTFKKNGQQTMVVIDAPGNVKVVRGELLEEKPVTD